MKGASLRKAGERRSLSSKESLKEETLENKMEHSKGLQFLILYPLVHARVNKKYTTFKQPGRHINPYSMTET